jgi:large subunit ribosomal protein L46
MNTWMVGRVPVAHLIEKPVYSEDGSLKERGDKIFFLKGRIMAGQADLSNNPYGYVDFKWLAKEELAEALTPEYYRSVWNMMADR